MVSMNNYAEHVKAAIDSGVDLIISGDVLPSHLPKFTKGSNVKIAPIVSSFKATKVILKLLDSHYKVSPDMMDIAKYLKPGASGVQMATRFLATYE